MAALRILVLVDLINDFFPGGSFVFQGGYAVGAHDIVPVVNSLLQRGNYDLVVAVNDTHPENHVGFADNHPGREVGEVVTLASGHQQMLWPKHGVAGTWGAAFHPDLDTSRIHSVLPKGDDPRVDSLSGFYNDERSGETNLRELIEGLRKQSGIAPGEVKVDVVGLCTNYCVRQTARDARGLGYDAGVVVDASRAFLLPGENEVETFRQLATDGLRVTYSAEILREVERRAGNEREIVMNLSA